MSVKVGTIGVPHQANLTK